MTVKLSFLSQYIHTQVTQHKQEQYTYMWKQCQVKLHKTDATSKDQALSSNFEKPEGLTDQDNLLHLSHNNISHNEVVPS